MAKRTLPPAHMISQLIRYDRDTGDLFWLPRTLRIYEQLSPKSSQAICDTWNRMYAGRPALQHLNLDGYRYGTIFAAMCTGHKAAWAVHYGEWPSSPVDHKNSDRADNRLANLRLATHAQNIQAARPPKGCKSAFKGVSWDKKNKIWVSRIYVNGKGIYVCRSHCEIEAAKAYDQAAKKFNGAFAYLNFPEGSA